MEKSIDQLTKELKEEKRKNDLLRDVSMVLGNLSSLEEKLNNILALLDSKFNLKHTMLLFPSKNNTVLNVFASRGFKNSGIGIEIPFNQGISGVVASNQKKLRISRLSHYRRYANAFTKGKNNGLKNINLPRLENAESQVALPLMANNELVAVLSCESEDINFFHQADEDLLMTLSQQIALSIQNSIVFEQLEDHVKLRTKELEKLNSTKDHLFSIIGHDLRSPVTALEGIAELFQYYNSSGKLNKLKELGPKISYAAKNVNQLLDNLLNWSMSQQDGLNCMPQEIDIHKMVKEVQHLFKDFLESKKIHFVLSGESKAIAYADYNMIFSVLRNVINNSIKFTPKKGTIDVDIFDEGKNIKVNISDTGIGISKEKIETLFYLQKNKSTLGTNRERGSGLGLVLVKEFIQLNNGSITICSSDKGTSVQLLLPNK